MKYYVYHEIVLFVYIKMRIVDNVNTIYTIEIFFYKLLYYMYIKITFIRSFVLKTHKILDNPKI